MLSHWLSLPRLSLPRTRSYGQEKSVFVYRLLASGSMEEKIYKKQVYNHTLPEPFPTTPTLPEPFSNPARALPNHSHAA